MKGIVENISELSDSKEMLHAKPYPFGIYFIYIILTILVVALTWSYFGEIDVVVKSTGIVRPENGVSTLTAKSGGKIDEIRVKNGDQVKAGDILLSLEKDYLLVQLEGVQKDLDKITRERELTAKLIQCIDTGINDFDKESEYDYYQQFAKYQMDSSKITENVTSLKKKLDYSQKDIDGYSKLLESVESGSSRFDKNDEYYLKYLDYEYKLKDLTETKALRKTQYEAMKKLNESGSVSKKELEDSRVSYDSSVTAYEKFKNEMRLSAENAIRTSKDNLSDYSLELSKLTPENTVSTVGSYFKNENLISLNDKLKGYDLQIDDLTDSLEKLQIEYENSYVRSPIDGIISFVDTFKEGDVLGAGVDVGTVIPKGETAYKVQLYIPNKDISLVNPGDKVKFRFDALPYKEYGTLEGTITVVNPDSSVNKTTGLSYYLAEADVDNKPLVSYKGQESSIKVGMTLEGQVVTKRKKILMYLLEKLDLR